MKILLIVHQISLVVAVPDPHIKKTDSNGNLHVHLNVPDLGPVEDVHINTLTQPRQIFKGRTRNRFGTQTGCPPGYDSKEGDIPGWGQLGGMIYTNKKGCRDRCNRNKNCCSFEYSDSWKLCNLNRDCQPSRGKYQDYVFCVKQNVRGQMSECMEKGFHYLGNTLRELITPTAEECACTCDDHKGCRFFTWSAKDNFCRLKYSNRGRTKTSEEFYSGSKDCCKEDRLFGIKNDIALYEDAKEYLVDKRKVLDEMVEIEGYKSCHPLDSSLDATECADDCKKFETEEFGRKCTRNGGLFKCCIRRDKKFCHECRFCCTLPMCTYKSGNKIVTHFDNVHKDFKARELFFSDKHLYKSPDYYCLKPNSHEDPKKWHRYEAAGFRKAFNKEMLENTQTFKYDKYLYNFEDPKILAAFTKNDKEARKIARKSYNFHYTAMIPGLHSTSYSPSKDNFFNMTKCVKECIKMEKSKFAKKCKKDGGYFKCCLSSWGLNPFEEVRNKLIDDKLIKDEKTHFCNRYSTKDHCYFCSANGMCTNRSYLDGKITNTFYPGKEKESKTNFDAATASLRESWCYVIDLCKYQREKLYAELTMYKEAMNKEQVCNAIYYGGHTGDYEPKKDITRCNRMVTGNIIHCPKAYKDGLDKDIVKEINMLMRLVRWGKKK